MLCIDYAGHLIQQILIYSYVSKVTLLNRFKIRMWLVKVKKNNFIVKFSTSLKKIIIQITVFFKRFTTIL